MKRKNKMEGEMKFFKVKNDNLKEIKKDESANIKFQGEALVIMNEAAYKILFKRGF